MKVFILNCGSSSIKFQMIDTNLGTVMAKGVVEKIGEEIGLYSFLTDDFSQKGRKLIVKDHKMGIQFILKDLMHPSHGVIKNAKEIDGVGHRIVHGGEKYSESVILDENVRQTIIECFELAPLHNPANFKGIEAIDKNMPSVTQVAVFDTAFHQTIPPKAFMYAIPKRFYEHHKIRRYGFHGTSHKYVTMRAAKFVGRPVEILKIITCHLGNGASIAAVNCGVSVDTSMGFTPLEGLMMGTRSGDMDPAIPLYMISSLGLSHEQVYQLLNKQSGLLGLSNLSNDMREIEKNVIEIDDKDAYLALEAYAYRIKKYIGSYIAAMNGADIIVFTGGVGENMPLLRQMVCSEMHQLGIRMDKSKNYEKEEDILEFNQDTSAIKLLKIPTNEELMIALEVEHLMS